MAEIDIDLADARAVLERARRHYREYNEVVHGQGLSTLWNSQERFEPKSGEWCYTISVDRGRLVAAKPILADAATNVTSALDHVAAAIAKSRKAERNGLYFPRLSDVDFQGDVKGVAKRIGDAMAAVLTRVREERKFEVPHVVAAREIANSGKHWELPLSEGSVMAVALHISGEPQRIFQVPADAFNGKDSHEYWRGAERLPNVAKSLVVRLEILGLSSGLPSSPDSIFEGSFRFVEGVIGTINAAFKDGTR